MFEQNQNISQCWTKRSSKTSYSIWDEPVEVMDVSDQSQTLPASLSTKEFTLINKRQKKMVVNSCGSERRLWDRDQHESDCRRSNNLQGAASDVCDEDEE